MDGSAAAMPQLARRLLWSAGLGLDALAILALIADAEPGETGSRITGAVVIAVVGSLALLAAVMSARRPAAARFLGLAAAGGMLLVAWIVLTQPGVSWITILVGLALLAMGATVGWTLLRWRPDRPPSGQSKDRADTS